MTPERAAVHGVQAVPLDDLLARAKVLSLHLVPSATTRHIINAERLAQMRPDSLLVNTSRAALIDTGALVHALRANQIGMANQQRDMGLGQMYMDAQRLNQGANMEATGMNRAFMGQTANQLANTDLARGQYQLGLGDALLATDPYRQAMQPGMQMGQFAGGAAGNAILGQMGGMIDLSGNAATFNTNRQDSLYNNYRNNQAAMRSANMQAGASSQAGMMGMIGSGAGAAIGIAGIGIAI